VNPYHKLSREEQKIQDAKVKEFKDNMEKVAQSAKSILSSEYGARYVDELNRARESTIDLMMNTANPDPVQDAFFLRACLAKISAFNLLLGSIKRDAR
jgi:hypothetical protein